MTTDATRILTLAEAVVLADIIRTAQAGSPVTRMLEDDRIVTGTARSVGDINGNFATGSDDVRDCFLRVTLSSGFEAFWPIAECVAAVNDNTLALNYRA